jgi:hypothetical protein
MIPTSSPLASSPGENRIPFVPHDAEGSERFGGVRGTPGAVISKAMDDVVTATLGLLGNLLPWMWREGNEAESRIMIQNSK